MTLSIRQGLTIWFTAAAAILLALLALSLTIVHQRISLARLDTDLLRLNNAVATVFASELMERKDPQAAAEEALIEVVVPGRHLAILTRDGTILAQRWNLSSPPTTVDASRAGEVIATLTTPREVRVVGRALAPVPDGYVIVTAATWDEVYADRADLVRALWAVIPVALVIAATGAWWVAGRALRPAAAMAAEARRLTDNTVGQRLTVARQDELGQLATAFNDLVGRLESAVDVRRQFLADASHELRTPVSIARTAADVALSRHDRTDAEYREALEVVAEQMKHLGRMVSDMLTLARSDMPDWPLAPIGFYLDELVNEAIRAMTLLASRRGVNLQATCPEELQMRGDEGLLHQMLVNLIENAIRHTPAGGTVRVTVTPAPHEIGVSVSDTGHGIPAGDQDRIFDRFVRLSEPGAPSDDGGGTGLGLAIARRIARAHHGNLILVSTGATGTVFGVTLPRASRASSARRSDTDLGVTT